MVIIESIEDNTDKDLEKIEARLTYNADMFRMAIPIIAELGDAVADYADGTHIGILNLLIVHIYTDTVTVESLICGS